MKISRIPVLVNRSIHDVSSLSTWDIEPERSTDFNKVFPAQFTITIGIQFIKRLPHFFCWAKIEKPHIDLPLIIGDETIFIGIKTVKNVLNSLISKWHKCWLENKNITNTSKYDYVLYHSEERILHFQSILQMTILFHQQIQEMLRFWWNCSHNKTENL